MSIRSPFLYQHFENDDGTPLSFGKVYTYSAGTTNPLATIDSNGVDNPNPVYLDAGGNADIYLKPGYAYKFMIKDADDVLISSGIQDNIVGSGSTGDSGSSVIVETIADLKLLSAGAYTYATVLGYYAKTDGIGPREYYWDSASTLTDDGGSVIKITATATGRWKLVAGKEIDAKWFGATGDGTTNDYPFIKAAHDYIVAIGGGKLVFTVGAYNLQSYITFANTVDLTFEPGAYLKSTNSSPIGIKKMSGNCLTKRFDLSIPSITFSEGIDKIYPEWFGALGDGTTDDSAAINMALATYNRIQFLEKTYMIGSQLIVTYGHEIVGGNATFKPNANSINIFSILAYDYTAGKPPVSLENFTILNDNSKTNVVGISASNALQIKMKNIWVSSCTSGIYLDGSKLQSFENIIVSGCTESGLKIKGNSNYSYEGAVFNNVLLEQNAVGLMAYGNVYPVLDIVYNSLRLVNNTVCGAYFYGCKSAQINGLYLYGNGSGAASIVIDSKTIYKSDLYLDASTVTIADSEVDSSLNNSIQLINSSCLNTRNFTGYASTTNTQMLVELGSKVVETGITTATGYKEWILDYGKINDIQTQMICYGIGKAIPTKASQYKLNKIRYPQYPTVTVNAPATGSHDNVCGLTRAITIANSIGSSGTNSASISMGTGLSAPYQISTILVMSDTNKEYMVKWSDNSASYQHAYTAPTNKATWVRHVFITSSKTSHTFEIWPTGASSSIIYLKEAMCYDGILEEVSNIYQNGLVYYTEFGNWNSAAPTAGTWVASDMVYNTAPASAGYMGWTCTSGGTPGTWKTFGLIS